MLSMTLGLLTVLVPLQIFLGDLHGLNTLRIPAGQARRDRGASGTPARRAPLTLFAIPDETAKPTATRSKSRIWAA